MLCIFDSNSLCTCCNVTCCSLCTCCNFLWCSSSLISYRFKFSFNCIFCTKSGINWWNHGLAMSWTCSTNIVTTLFMISVELVSWCLWKTKKHLGLLHLQVKQNLFLNLECHSFFLQHIKVAAHLTDILS